MIWYLDLAIGCFLAYVLVYGSIFLYLYLLYKGTKLIRKLLKGL